MDEGVILRSVDEGEVLRCALVAIQSQYLLPRSSPHVVETYIHFPLAILAVWNQVSVRKDSRFRKSGWVGNGWRGRATIKAQKSFAGHENSKGTPPLSAYLCTVQSRSDQGKVTPTHSARRFMTRFAPPCLPQLFSQEAASESHSLPSSTSSSSHTITVFPLLWRLNSSHIKFE